MKKLLFFSFIFLLTTYNFAQIDVQFRADMGVQVYEQLFDPSSDIVVVRGDFQNEAGDPGGDWQGDMFTMSDPDGDTIYTVTASIPSNFEGTEFQFKFVISPDGWESIDNRMFTLTGPSPQILPIYWFNNDSVHTFTNLVQNTFNFTADISGILGVGSGGAFDPTQDSLLVMGLDWDGNGTLISDPADRRMFNTDPINPGIYTTTLIVEGVLGDSTAWKYKAFPDSRFPNNGWETGDNRWLSFQPDGSTIDLPVIIPRIQPYYDPISSDIDIVFRVDMTDAVNRYNNEPIDPDELEFVGLRGSAEFLGDWTSGCWCVDDTTNGFMKVLNDDGVNGDLIADDDIWSITVTAPAGHIGGLNYYKFAAMYPGADTVNGGSFPLDNEGGFGVNHSFLLIDGPTQYHYLAFGYMDGEIPVELKLFNANIDNYTIKLHWLTETETNNLGFEIERSFTENNWTKIGFVEGNGTTTESSEYFFSEEIKNFNGKINYRLKQIDYDGSFEYSRVVEVEVNTIPQKFTLFQNYPNPFNPTTTIKYSIPQASKVELKIYDLLGKEVAELVNENKEAGEYEVQFNAENLSSGMYFYRLTADGKTFTKKLMLLK